MFSCPCIPTIYMYHSYIQYQTISLLDTYIDVIVTIMVQSNDAEAWRDFWNADIASVVPEGGP